MRRLRRDIQLHWITTVVMGMIWLTMIWQLLLSQSTGIWWMLFLFFSVTVGLVGGWWRISGGEPGANPSACAFRAGMISVGISTLSFMALTGRDLALQIADPNPYAWGYVGGFGGMVILLCFWGLFGVGICGAASYFGGYIVYELHSQRDQPMPKEPTKKA